MNAVDIAVSSPGASPGRWATRPCYVLIVLVVTGGCVDFPPPDDSVADAVEVGSPGDGDPGDAIPLDAKPDGPSDAAALADARMDVGFDGDEPIITSDVRVVDARPSDALGADASPNDADVPDLWAPDRAIPDVERPDAALADVALHDATPPDATVPDSARLDAAQFDAARSDSARPDAARPDAARPDAAQPEACVLVPERCGDGLDNDGDGQVDNPAHCGVDADFCERGRAVRARLLCEDFTDENIRGYFDEFLRDGEVPPVSAGGSYGLDRPGSGGHTLDESEVRAEVRGLSIAFDVVETGGEIGAGVFARFDRNFYSDSGYFLVVQTDAFGTGLYLARNPGGIALVESDAPQLAQGGHRVQAVRDAETLVWTLHVDGTEVGRSRFAEDEPWTIFGRSHLFASAAEAPFARIDNFAVEWDADDDGRYGDEDLCPYVRDTDGTDTDCDGIGDRCDFEGTLVYFATAHPERAGAYFVSTRYGIRRGAFEGPVTTRAVAFAPDVYRVAWIDASGELLIADSPRGEPVETGINDISEPSWLDGGRLIYADADHRRISMRTGNLSRFLLATAPGELAIRAAGGPRGRRIAVWRNRGDGATLSIVDSAAEVVAAAVPLPDSLIGAELATIGPHPDQPRIVVAVPTGEARGVWEISLTEPAAALRRTDRGARAAAYTPDGAGIVALEASVAREDASAALRLALHYGVADAGGVDAADDWSQTGWSQTVVDGVLPGAWVTLGWARPDRRLDWDDRDHDGVDAVEDWCSSIDFALGTEWPVSEPGVAARQPQLAAFGDRIAVSWTGVGPAQSRTGSFVQLGYTGTIAAPPRLLGDPQPAAPMARPVRAGNELAVIWLNGEGESTLRFARFDPDGAPIGETLDVVTRPGIRSPSLTYDEDQARFRAVWQSDVPDGGGVRSAVHILDLDARGVVIGEGPRIVDDVVAASLRDQVEPASTWNDGTFGLVWRGEAADGIPVLYARGIDTRRPPAGVNTRRITDDGAVPARPAAAATHDAYGIGVAWIDERNGGADLYFRFLDPDGAPQAPEVRVTENGGVLDAPRIVWDEYRFVLVWTGTDASGSTAIHATEVDPATGDVRDPLRLSDPARGALRPSLAITAAGFVVAWEDGRYGEPGVFVVHDPFNCPISW